MLEFHKLSPSDKEMYYAVQGFASTRLESYEAVDWALKISLAEGVKIAAITDLLNNPSALKLADPWLRAWALIKETWSRSARSEPQRTSSYLISDRISSGERTVRIIEEIVDLVRPYLKVEAIKKRLKKTPKSVEHIVFARLSSEELIEPGEISLDSINELDFLVELASSLEKAIDKGIYLARQAGWDESKPLFYLGSLGRVYFPEDDDPDEFSSGITPAVRLLAAVVKIIGEKSPENAKKIVESWYSKPTPIFTRLWAAFARYESLVDADELAHFLMTCTKTEFWKIYDFPEVSEARAIRFSDFTPNNQKQIAKRIMSKPPRKFWPKKSERGEVDNAQEYWVARELRRIIVAGGELNVSSTAFLNNKLLKFPVLSDSKIDQGFPQGPKSGWVQPTPDLKFDSLEGIERLKALESILKTSNEYWHRTPAGQANDWLTHELNVLKLIDDFHDNLPFSHKFPNVIERIGWTHSLKGEEDENVSAITQGFIKYLSIVEKLSTAELSQSIEGISQWFDNWKEKVRTHKRSQDLWYKVWPVAAASTNAGAKNGAIEDLSTVAWSYNADDNMDLDTLNTASGKMVGVFLHLCPSLVVKKRPFNVRSIEYKMREAIFSESGKTLLIAQHRLIENLNYFMAADQKWTKQNLIAPLQNNSDASIPLWRSLSRRHVGTKILAMIGSEMILRVTDKRLGRTPRRNFVYGLIWDTLESYRKKREPAVSIPDIQQLIRIVDDETRASCAEAIRIYLRDVTKGKTQDAESQPAFVFTNAVKPFLTEVWPQERTLITKSISKIFVQIPSFCANKFAEAADVVIRFIVAFDCYSMFDFRIFPENGTRKPTLSIIKRKKDARALLNILDQSIGHALDAVSPRGLSGALEKVETIDPKIAKSRQFKRLAVLRR